MGMSASQARLLSITARLADTELKGQQVANAKIRLGNDSEEVSQKYLEALQGKKLKMNVWDDAAGKMKLKDMTANLLYSNDYQVRAKDGTIATKPADNKLASQYTAGEKLYARIQADPDYLLNGLESSNLILQAYEEQTDGSFAWQDKSISATSDIEYVTDDAEIAVAEAQYNADMTKINNKEKLLDQETTKIDTEHNALQTEYDSVKKVIEKNIERTFKIFS